MRSSTALLNVEFRSERPVRTLWMLLSGSRLNLLSAAILYIIKFSPVWMLQVYVPYVLGILRQPNVRPLSELWWASGIVFVATAQNVLTHTLYVRQLSRTIRRMECRLRQALIFRLQQLSMGFLSGQQSGRLQTKIVRDVETVQGLAQLLIESGLSSCVTMAIALSVTLVKDVRAAALYAILVPVTLVIHRSFRSRIESKNRHFRVAIETMSARVSELIAMLPITRAHGLEEMEIRKISDEFEEVHDTGIKLDVVNGVFGAVSWVVLQLPLIVFVAIIGTWSYRTGEPPIEDVALFVGFYLAILSAVNTILSMYPAMARGFESIRSIGEVLECTDIEHNEGKRAVTMVKGRVCFENVTFSYMRDRQPAVSDLSLDVSPGECVAFVGQSGSGKSTVMNLIIGFRRPDSGRIFLDGEDMQTLDLRTFRRHIAVIPQETILFSGSIRDNITHGLGNVGEDRLRKVIEDANVAEFVDPLPAGLESDVGERGAKLSGGQRQRIAVARALLRDPRIILLDEATSALDVVSEKLVQESLDRLMHDRTTFIVAHRLSTIRRAGRIVVMKEGRCIETGTHDELMQRRGEFFLLKSLQT